MKSNTKPQFISCVFMLFFIATTSAQSSVTFYISSNYTRSTQTFTKGYNCKYTYNYILLPGIGFDYYRELNKHFSIGSGLGFNLMGTKNYYTYDLEFFEMYPDLVISCLSIPVKLKYSISRHFFIYGGYQLNSTIWKNREYYSGIFCYPQTWVSFYNNLQHTGLLGFGLNIGNISVSAAYQTFFNDFVNTHEYYKKYKVVEKFEGFQFVLGYRFNN